MTVLTADLVARAIIAAAVHYGDNPERAFTVSRGFLRRSLKPAALGLQAVLGGDLKTYAKLIGLEHKGIYTGRTEEVQRAAAAAAEAVRYALGPAIPAPVEVVTRVEAFVRRLEPMLPGLFAACPKGVTSAQMSRASGLDKTACAEAARLMNERRIARWQRSGTKNEKVLRPWSDPPPRKPEPVSIAPPDQRAPVVVVRPAATPTRAHISFTAPRPSAAIGPDGTLRARICRMLRGTDASTQGLATLLDAKELLVGQSLLAMEHEGLVVADPMPVEGRRFQRWRLREDIAA